MMTTELNSFSAARLPFEEKLRLCAHLIDHLDADRELIAGLLELVDEPVLVAKSLSNGLGARVRSDRYAGEITAADMADHDVQDLAASIIDDLINTGISLREITPFLQSAERTCSVMTHEAARIEAEIEADSLMRNGM